MDTLWQDARYAVRTLSRSRGFTAIAILLLALGIGANTAVFSLVYETLLRPLPYPHSDRLVQVVRAGNGPQVGMPEYAFTHEHASLLESVAAFRPGNDRIVNVGGNFESVSSLLVTEDFFRTLGVAPTQGRAFEAEDLRAGTRTAIISDALSQRVFGVDQVPIGRALTLDETPYVIVGILPPTFWFPQSADVMIPLVSSNTISDLGSNTTMIGRLRPDASAEQADAELQSFTRALRESISKGLPSSYRGLFTDSFHDRVTGDAARTNLTLLFAAVALLLLIACSNLASLTMTRLASREKEIATRMALGGSRTRIVRQFLVETVLLTAAGSTVGLLLGSWVLDSLLAIIPFRLTTSTPVGLSLPALGVTCAAAALTNLMFTLAPLLATARLNLNLALKAGSRAVAGGSGQRLRAALVSAQVAASVVVLVCAVVLVQSMMHLNRQQLGFAPEGATTFVTPVSPARKNQPDALRQFQADLLQRLAGAAGVHHVAAASILPLAGFNNFPTQRDGHPDQSIGAMEIREVTPDFFAALGIPIVRGRAFTASDTNGTPPVIVVSEMVARTWWPNRSPLGDHVDVGRFQGRSFGEDPAREVVGVVGDTKTFTLQAPSRPTVYVPAAQWEPSGMSWVVRGNVSAEQLRQIVRDVDPRQQVDRMRPMTAIVATASGNARFDAWLFAGLAGLALALTGVGIYGLLAFAVSRRVQEIGTRMALGARPSQVVRWIFKRSGVLVLIGLGAGLAGAHAASQLWSGLLFGVQATDWPGYLAAAGLVVFVAGAATYFPARRAARVDPVTALRSE